MENMTGKWCCSTDEECYTGASDTEAEAHSAAQSAIDDESGWCSGGIVKDYWIAQCVHPLDTIRQDIGDDVLEMLTERMADEVGGDDVPIDMAPEHEIELGKLIIDFVREHCTVQQYGIKDPAKHQYIIGSKANE
jgi:hypothetical protein